MCKIYLWADKKQNHGQHVPLKHAYLGLCCYTRHIYLSVYTNWPEVFDKKTLKKMPILIYWPRSLPAVF